MAMAMAMAMVGGRLESCVSVVGDSAGKALAMAMAMAMAAETNQSSAR
jgi:acetyl esterase/lipase